MMNELSDTKRCCTNDTGLLHMGARPVGCVHLLRRVCDDLHLASSAHCLEERFLSDSGSFARNKLVVEILRVEFGEPELFSASRQHQRNASSTTSTDACGDDYLDDYNDCADYDNDNAMMELVVIVIVVAFVMMNMMQVMAMRVVVVMTMRVFALVLMTLHEIMVSCT